jgi:hypothetical protein
MELTKIFRATCDLGHQGLESQGLNGDVSVANFPKCDPYPAGVSSLTALPRRSLRAQSSLSYVWAWGDLLPKTNLSVESSSGARSQ